MNIVDAAIILVLVGSIALQIVLARANAKVVRQGVAFLDENLAEAIRTTLENLPEALKEQAAGIEPMNPIQMMIAQLIQERMNPGAGHVVIERADGGQFKKLDDF